MDNMAMTGNESVKRTAYAAIDIGSNAVRLLIKELEDCGEPHFNKVLLLRVPLRLGFDVFAQGRISDRREKDMVRLMKCYRHLMKIYQVKAYRACATSAMRDAANGPHIIREVEKKTGIKIEIIDGQEEARMIYNNHIENMKDRRGNFMYVDVGGGSTEINLLADGELVCSRSYNIGTVRMLNNAVEESEKSRIRRDMKDLAVSYPGINIIGSGEQWGYYIEGFKDVDAGDVTLAKCISAVVDKSALTGRNTEGVLSSFDYTAESGFIFFLNNRSSDTAIDSYAPSDGDVIRIQYSIYGYGSDIGIDNSSWGGASSVIPETNRDALTALIAEALDEGVDCTDAIAVISNMDSTQEQLDTAYSALEIALTPQVSDENTENDSASTEQQDQQTENNSAVTEEQDQQTESNDKTPATGASAKLLFIPVCSAIAALIISGKSRFSEN